MGDFFVRIKYTLSLTRAKVKSFWNLAEETRTPKAGFIVVAS